jgi:hypothetical protein
VPFQNLDLFTGSLRLKTTSLLLGLPGLDLLAEFQRRPARRGQFEGFASFLPGLVQVSGRKIQPAQHQVRIGGRLKFQRNVGFFAGSPGVAGALPDLGQARVGLGGLGSAATAA